MKDKGEAGEEGEGEGGEEEGEEASLVHVGSSRLSDGISARTGG